MWSMPNLKGGNGDPALASHAFSTPPQERCSAKRPEPFEPIASAGARHGGFDAEPSSAPQRFEPEPMRGLGASRPAQSRVATLTDTHHLRRIL